MQRPSDKELQKLIAQYMADVNFPVIQRDGSPNNVAVIRLREFATACYNRGFDSGHEIGHSEGYADGVDSMERSF